MLDHIAVSNLLHATIPISRFNKGEANKIFDEVSAAGFKVVVKNNKPTCVLIAPDKYTEIMEIMEDYHLFLEAEKRMIAAETKGFISAEEVYKELGISESDLEGVEVEFE